MEPTVPATSRAPPVVALGWGKGMQAGEELGGGGAWRSGGDRPWLGWWVGGGERENEAVFCKNESTLHPTLIFSPMLGAEDVSSVKKYVRQSCRAKNKLFRTVSLLILI